MKEAMWKQFIRQVYKNGWYIKQIQGQNLWCYKKRVVYKHG